MGEKHDGGPAFPRQTWDYYPSQKKTQAGNSDPGMSLRDWFAGQALAGIIAGLAQVKDNRLDGKEEAGIAGIAYLIADAMLAERNKPHD